MIAASLWGIVFGLLSAAGFVAAICYGPAFLKNIAAAEGHNAFTSTALVALTAIIPLWLLRHISRLLVTNLRGMDDASRRVAMITTYLALINRSGTDVTEAERIIFYNAIFQHPQDTADDSPPPTLLEFLRENAAGKSAGS